MEFVVDNPLEQLKDIHLPESASWWPPSWQLLALIFATAILLSLMLTGFLLHHKRTKAKREALTLLINISQQGLDDKAYLDELAKLTRRFAISKQPKSSQLSGEQWHNFLSAYMPVKDAKAIALSRYQLQTNIDRESLLKSCEKLIKGIKA